MSKMAMLADLYTWRDRLADEIRNWQTEDGPGVLNELHRERDRVLDQIREAEEAYA